MPVADGGFSHRLRPCDFMRAARVPDTVPAGEFGLWTIERVAVPAGTVGSFLIGGPTQTILRRATLATLHTAGEIVMEDGRIELSKHLPIWMHGRGRILVTGLGLGCVVRGLLASPAVEKIDVVEIDGGIIRAIAPEFAGQRVTVHHGDALTIDLPGSWDFAWHDLWCEGGGLQLLHLQLMHRFQKRCGPQGAWAMPRWVKRRANFRWLG